DLEGSYARARLPNRCDDLRDESLLRFSEELQGQVELLRTDDLQRGAGPPELIREGRERGRWRDVHRDEPAERHGRAPSGSAATPPMASATVATSSYHVWRFTRFPPNQSATSVPWNGSPRMAARNASRSRPWTTLSGVRSRTRTWAATGSNTMLGPAAE